MFLLVTRYRDHSSAVNGRKICSFTQQNIPNFPRTADGTPGIDVVIPQPHAVIEMDSPGHPRDPVIEENRRNSSVPFPEALFLSCPLFLTAALFYTSLGRTKKLQ